jgi:hypothetical protein
MKTREVCRDWTFADEDGLLRSPYATDRWGRKPSIIAGCLFMIVGGFINTFSKNMGSEFSPRASAASAPNRGRSLTMGLQCSWLVVAFSASETRSRSWPLPCS